MKINRVTLNIIFIAVILLLFSGVASAAIFSDDFETGDFSAWTSTDWFLITTSTKGYSAVQDGIHIGASMTKSGLSIPADFDGSYWLKANSQSSYAELAIEDAAYDGIVYIHMKMIPGLEKSWIAYRQANYTMSYLYLSDTFDINDYIDVDGWVKIGISKIGNELFLKVNDGIITSVVMVDPYPSIAANELSIFYIYSHDAWATILFDDIFLVWETFTIYKPSGYVIDWNGIPVQDVLVTFWGEDEYGNYHDVSQFTNSIGFYNITLPYDGIWDFVASKDGYADSQGWGYFSNNGTELTNITMYNVNIYGTVYDAKTHIPIVDASVDFIQADYYPNHSSYHASTLSDANGSYSFNGFLVNKPIDIFASHDGYFQIENFSITPPQAGNYILDIYLMPDDPCPNNVCGLTVRLSFINSTFYYGANATLGNVPISNATVNLWNDTYSNSTLSLDWGYYQIPVYANGTYSINANKSSYATRGNENVTVVDYTAVKSLLLVCKGDINLDEYVNVNDFVLFACFYNSNSSGSNYYWLADFDNSTKINADDFVQFATVYHTQCMR